MPANRRGEPAGASEAELNKNPLVDPRGIFVPPCTPPSAEYSCSWNKIIIASMKPDWLQTNIESLIDQFFAYLNGQSQEFKPVISMGDLKTNLNSEIATPR
ncbi:MAG: hypothetical protein CEN88_204 [Candidatus Berkelbacteria bacterium Licking1014_2]|uniref:Uncharacterized protein n=1 Tax=Candidatus Berkelbacteria bacterium Licking1014_2 TaxID=2017146 RepID=A0A554LW34_9BACT|nr:MAG: hypothetical protein CEN88_204 [Candidatus Berkelbacteria bacterium Licking1014_2]